MTSGTDELRRLLDERGVEWWQKKRHTCWKVSKGQEVEMWRAWEAPDGSLTLKVDYIYGLTPEQAIAATLGRGSCQQEEHGWSTEGDHARVWLTCGHDCMVETVADLPNYCPICGAEVMHA